MHKTEGSFVCVFDLEMRLGFALPVMAGLTRRAAANCDYNERQL